MFGGDGYASTIENNSLTNVSDAGSYANPNTGAPRGPLAPLNFVCGVNGEDVVNGWTISVVNPAAAIPGKIEAGNCSDMSSIQTETTTDTGGGRNVGYMDTGDWLDYSVNVATAGTYNVDFRVASLNANTQLQLKKGSTVLATVNVPYTGGWQNWQTVTVKRGLYRNSGSSEKFIPGLM